MPIFGDLGPSHARLLRNLPRLPPRGEQPGQRRGWTLAPRGRELGGGTQGVRAELAHGGEPRACTQGCHVALPLLCTPVDTVTWGGKQEGRGALPCPGNGETWGMGATLVQHRWARSPPHSLGAGSLPEPPSPLDARRAPDLLPPTSLRPRGQHPWALPALAWGQQHPGLDAAAPGQLLPRAGTRLQEPPTALPALGHQLWAGSAKKQQVASLRGVWKVTPISTGARLVCTGESGCWAWELPAGPQWGALTAGNLLWLHAWIGPLCMAEIQPRGPPAVGPVPSISTTSLAPRWDWVHWFPQSLAASGAQLGPASAGRGDPKHAPCTGGKEPSWGTSSTPRPAWGRARQFLAASTRGAPGPVPWPVPCRRRVRVGARCPARVVPAGVCLQPGPPGTRAGTVWEGISQASGLR
ncbi:uncharacterized protein LOC112552113 [Alligator sinensis]|uniref:Uncharacterized protein LOC112552113 n=1 Tax=Alligator sinensis TaxID=38654 RepID=A0A3Q0HQ90_ALLSI|nr:uncharacterized protein LOC112552113 [Alligator sinensis]